MFHNRGPLPCVVPFPSFGPCCVNGVQILQFSMAAVQHSICVSFTSKENTVLRSGALPHQVSVIPNAVDATVFVPDPAQRETEPPETITVVVVSRLAYRKGADLLVDVIPAVCHQFPQVHPHACKLPCTLP